MLFRSIELKKKIEGGTKMTYKEKKNYIREIAIDYQLNFYMFNYSYIELVEFQEYITPLAQRYGLLKEFRENGIL